MNLTAKRFVHQRLKSHTMSKQIIQSQGLPAGRHGNIVEKVLRDKEGKLIRARFFVYENGGRIKARLLDFVYIAEQALLNGAKFLLSTVSTERCLGLFSNQPAPFWKKLSPVCCGLCG